MRDFHHHLFHQFLQAYLAFSLPLYLTWPISISMYRFASFHLDHLSLQDHHNIAQNHVSCFTCSWFLNKLSSWSETRPSWRPSLFVSTLGCPDSSMSITFVDPHCSTKKVNSNHYPFILSSSVYSTARFQFHTFNAFLKSSSRIKHFKAQAVKRALIGGD